MSANLEAKPVCFVIMPFSSKFERIWHDGIRPAAMSAGFTCVRGDSTDAPGAVMQFVIRHIFDADVIVADLTTLNPNVLYELGIAHAIANKTIMINADASQQLPFDVATHRIINYSKTAVRALRDRLTDVLRQMDQVNEEAEGCANPVRLFGPSLPFVVPYRKEAKSHAVGRVFALSSGAGACLSAELRDGRPFDRQADGTVFTLLSHHTPTLGRVHPSEVDLAAPGRDFVVIGSPRFNPVAERIQQFFDLPCEYVSARATGDAGSRDESTIATASQRALRIVTRHGDELAASIDNGIGHDGAGTDYGLIVLAQLDHGRRLIWLSGIHGKGTLGVYDCATRYADRILAELDAIRNQTNKAITYLVRVKYAANSSEGSIESIEGEILGERVVSGVAPKETGRRALLIDLGDVVMKFYRERTYRSIGHLTGLDYREVELRIKKENEHTKLVSGYEMGAISTEDFCTRLAALFPADDRLREWLPEFWGDIFWPNYEMFEVLWYLKKENVALALVSNTNPLHFEHVQKDYPDIVNLFDARSLSYEVKSAKPSDGIFHDAIEKVRRLGIHEREMLYADDMPQHVAHARQLGVDGFVYRSHSHFVFWLRKRGIYVPTVADECTAH